MSKPFRWVGPGHLKEDHADGDFTMHKPGSLLEKHGLSDATVDQFVKAGWAEYYKLSNGQVVSLDEKGRALPEATPVQSTDATDTVQITEFYEANAALTDAAQNVAKKTDEAARAAGGAK